MFWDVDKLTPVKSFPVTVLLTHGARALNLSGPERMMYIAGLITTSTLLGAVALQAKDFFKGRTPRDIDNATFWRDAMLQGGWTGILGDIFVEDPSSFGGVTKRLAGPLASDVEDMVNILWSTGQEVFDKDKKMWETLQGKGLRKAESFVPNTWYTKLLIERYLYDNINKQIDPKWHKRQRAFSRRLKEEYGSKQYWKPGKSISECSSSPGGQLRDVVRVI